MIDTTSTIVHHWAVYDSDGNVLDTVATPGDGGYWIYKNKIGTTVGPYPDRDRPMLKVDVPCDGCIDGKVSQTTTIPFGDPLPEFHDPTVEAEVQTCFACGGHGVQPRNGSTYKTPASAARGRSNGTATTCKTWCKGTGKVLRINTWQDHFACSGRGWHPSWDATRAVLPPEVNRCDTATPQFMADYLATVTITVLRMGDELTWWESYLGSPLGSCTDYGTRWDREDDTDLVFEVVEQMLRGVQYTKFIDQHTQQFAPAIIIRLTTSGYATYPWWS